MRFEIGKYYKHTTGNMLHILGELDTTMYGAKALIAEVANGVVKSDVKVDVPEQKMPSCGCYETFIAVGRGEDSATNYSESTEGEWMKNFC